MKSFFTLLFITIISLYTVAQEPNRIALIIAIGNYPESSGWDKLSSLNDVPLIKGALKAQGFKDENITIIADRQATLEGMKNAFDKYLTQKVKKGDIAVFHYSGHGQQIIDDNGDEGDGLDEALVPFDATQEPKPGSTPKHFRDDLLGKKIKELRTALGPTGNLLLILDACHSGTATRGIGIKRGTNKIYGTPEELKQLRSRKNTEDQDYGIIEDGSNLAPMAAFEASSPDQCNSEAEANGKGVGSLSLAFSRAIEKVSKEGDKSTTYRGLFDDIKVEMGTLVPGQSPMAEGDLDKIIFGGKMLTKPSYYTADIDSVTKNGSVQISVGKIYGIFEGTTVKLYKPDTRQSDTANTTPWATGVITMADQYYSKIKLDKKLSVDEIKRAWIYLDKINYGELAIKVKLNIADAQQKKLYQSYLANVQQASLTEEGGDLFLESGMHKYPADSVYLVTPEEIVIWSTPKNSDQNIKDKLQTKIADYALARYLKNLSLTNPEYEVLFEIVPLKCVVNCDDKDKAKWVDDDLKKKIAGSGNIIFKEGDKFRFNIINKTNKRLYYTIIDVQPDNIVNVLLPRPGEPAENYIIRPDQEKFPVSKRFTIYPPYGNDVFKIIASDVPLDLRKAFEAEGDLKPTRGIPLSPFEKVINDRLKKGAHTRGGGGDVELQTNTVNIINTSITIKPK